MFDNDTIDLSPQTTRESTEIKNKVEEAKQNISLMKESVSVAVYDNLASMPYRTLSKREYCFNKFR